MTETVTLPAVELHRQLVAALGSGTGDAGSAADAGADAARASRWLTQAEQLGLPGFGVGMLLRDLERVAAPDGAAIGGDVPPPQGSAPIAALDATGVPGPLALATATRLAAAAAAAHGVGVVGIRNVGALGILGFAARDLAADGAVGLVAAHAPAKVAPWGGTRPVVGTNPLAVAAPRPDAPPLVADFATAPITQAALAAHRASGTPIAADIALDAAGAPTLDAAQVATILPQHLLGSLGGLLVELLAGVAVGGRVPAGHAASGRGALVLALDPARAGGARAALDTAQLAADWSAAGGHVPARFDALPLGAAVPRGDVTVAAESLAALRALRDGGPR
ncbi:Ldh family oxidoreductase [Leucobacter chromiireducens]|uniref:Lactate dehydrogenase n=1 Tax=Leucobacter chromiireducens subsp. solipictus TaxID=398235 RepID=A0ABS1SFY5_9MICO|nr:Ldh family oxidoreductase [Leucobacter chromiireducens]MBL3679463.1 lactate dehydrogenase [Leucobacter chromiireducens subsp. solipictus]